jgi:nucleoside-diphosphate-sugar epimerase
MVNFLKREWPLDHRLRERHGFEGGHMSESCLVTGGGGFIGQHLIKHLSERARYRTIYLLDVRPPCPTTANVVYIERDICAPFALTLPDDCRTCFHLAAVCKEPGYPWDEYFRTNFAGTRNLCDMLELSPIDKIVFTSTMMVYRAGDGQKAESSLTSPDTAYGLSKLLAEQVLLAWQGRRMGRQLAVLRPGIVFGPGENGNFRRLYKALRGGYFAYIGRRSTVKGTIYVKDLVRCIEFVTHDLRSVAIYNAVLPNETSIEEICGTFSEVFGFRNWFPTVPYHLALCGALFFELISVLGVQSDVHRRRIQKLYYSTNLSAQALQEDGFEFKYTLKSALYDWQRNSQPGTLA